MSNRPLRRHLTLAGITLVSGLMLGCSDQVPETTHPAKSQSGQSLLSTEALVRLGTLLVTRELLAAEVHEGSVVAIDRERHLRTFDSRTLQLVKSRSNGWYTCLGRGKDGEILAGAADGNIVRVDPTTLEATSVAKVSGPPAWVGVDQAKRLHAVVGRVIPGPPPWIEPSALYDIDGKTSIALPELGLGGQYYLMGDQRRFWIGVDQGEFGGRCSYIDLDSGQLHEVATFRDELGLRGFASLRDGTTLTFGGMNHMSLGIAYIAKVGPAGLTQVYRQGTENDPVPSDRPTEPITHLLEASDSDMLIVVSEDGVFQASTDFQQWKRLADVRRWK